MTAPGSHESPESRPTELRDDAPQGTPRLADGTVVAGRYRLGEVLGEGGASVVHAAEDVVTGDRVAVKLLRAGHASANPRVGREVAALRLLSIPGVVALRDEGVHEGTRFLVMERVSGRPFPGSAARTWESVAPLVYSLLETLARVHAAGVVHRDLKPSNVLVTPDGRVTIVDFGLSRGPALGPAVTMVGTVVGTPEYLAPEQVLGRTADARSDLYAVGVMLYEALGGRLPHESREFHRLLEMKRSTPPAPLRVLAPDVPRDVAEVVDRLLAVDPLDRPESASAASQMLFGRTPEVRAAGTIRRLGDGSLAARIRATAEAGRSADVWGPAGSGRTRLLADVAARLETAGRRVVWAVPATQPYASLAPVLGGFDDLRLATRAEAERAISERLESLLRGGTVLVADDVERLDAWSSAAIERTRGAGAVLRAHLRAVPGAVEATPFSEEDLRTLFDGPDRVLHLREDGARELWRRTGGLPGLVVSEVGAWVRAGFASVRDGRVVMSRSAVDRLRGGLSAADELLLRPGPRAPSEELDEILAWIALAWPHSAPEVLANASGEPRWRLEPEIDALVAEGLARRVADGRIQPLVMPRALEVWDDERRRRAHRALASALPAGAPIRLRHLAAGGDPGDVVEEALALTPSLVRSGRVADAQAVAEVALHSARHGAGADAEERALAAWAWACVAEGTVAAVDRALYEHGRSRSAGPGHARLETFLRGVREAIAGDARRAVRILGKVGPMADGELELWRHAYRFQAAQRLPPPAEEEVLLEFEHWCRVTSIPRADANRCSWRALHLYRQGRHVEAARLHLEAAAASEQRVGTVACHVNAALAFLEGGDPVAARDAARAAARIASEARYSGGEAWALAAGRQAEYRLGGGAAPDAEFVAIASSLGDPSLAAFTALTEAAFAWRSGDAETARRLALESVTHWREIPQPASEALAYALAVLCGAPASEDDVRRAVERAADPVAPMMAAQTLALLAAARPGDAPRLRAAIPEFLRAARPADPSLRWDVLSAAECEGTAEIRGAPLRGGRVRD